MSTSKYFGKSFTVVKIQSEGGGHILHIGEHPGEETYFPGVGRDDEEALLGLVETLRVTRKLLKEFVRMKGVRITDSNEFNREMTSTAKKIGETPEDVQVIAEQICTELFQEMLAKQSKKK